MTATFLAMALRLAVHHLPLPHNSLSQFVTAYPWTSCISLSLFIWIFDRAFLYPRFRTPLKQFTFVQAFNIMAENPRGKQVLKWFHQHPDADVVVMRTPLGRCVTFPASPDAMRDIVGTNSYHWQKPWGIRAFLGRVIGFGLIMSEGDAHKMQRKALTPAFNIKNIRALYPLMWEKTTVLIDQLKAENEKQGWSEISHWASRLTLDIIGPAALSRDFDTMRSDHDPVAEAFGDILDPSPELVTFMVSNLIFPQWFMTRLPVRANKIIRQQCAQLRQLCRGILDEKHDSLKQAEEGKSVVNEEDDILKNIITSGQFNDDEVIDQMLTFLAAGHETTASALTWCIYMLSEEKNKDVQRRLREEIRSNVSNPVSSSMLESLPLLNGVCEETFRLYPTVPLTIREAKQDTVVGGVAVPKGTEALIVPYAINRHPQFWGADAEEFVPERWIDKTPEGSRVNKHGGAHSNFCEMTFLHGARACIGRDFAKAELRCAVAGLIGCLEFDLCDPKAEVVIGGTVTTKPVGGLKIRCKYLPGWIV